MLSAAWHCDFSGPGPTHGFLGTGLPWPPLARCQVSTSPARSGCGGAGGNSPHRLTCTELEGRSACGASQLAPRSSLGLQASPFSLFLQLSVHLNILGASSAGVGAIRVVAWAAAWCGRGAGRGHIANNPRWPAHTPLVAPAVGVPAPLVCPWGKGESAPERGPAGFGLNKRCVGVVLPTATR